MCDIKDEPVKNPEPVGEDKDQPASTNKASGGNVPDPKG